jgi:hypothetical protein
MAKGEPHFFGNFEVGDLKKVKLAFFHPDNLFEAVVDSEALHDQSTLDTLIERFPSNLIRDFDLFLLLAECMANAVSYSDTKLLGIHVRRRHRLILFSVFHEPAIADSVDYVLRNAHDGWLPDYESDPPSGLGFPILFRLAYQITISPDRHRLQLWVRLRNSGGEQSPL